MVNYLPENRKFFGTNYKHFLLTSCEVASPIAWERDPQLVLDFYNLRRKQLYEVEPKYIIQNLTTIKEKATTGIREFIELLNV